MNAMSVRVGVCLGGLLLGASLAAAEPPQGLMTLVSGDVIPGALRPASEAGAIRWQGGDFVRPFEFPIATVATAQFPAVVPTPPMIGDFVIELVTGDVLAGNISAWEEGSITFDSRTFGVIHVRAEAVRRLYRLNDNPTVVFPSLTGLTGWRTNGKTWREDGPQIQTDQDLAIITRDLGLPDLAVIEFELSWPEKPSFVLALGVDPAGDVDKRQDGWRFETWGDALTIVREQALRADVDKVHALIPSVKRTHLFAYLNQPAGTLHVFHSGGTPAASISVPPEPNRQRGTGIRLINRQGGVRLERLRVARWNGVLPLTQQQEQAHCQLADGTAIPGRIVGLAPDRRTFRLLHHQDERTVDAATLVSAEVSFGPDDRTGPVAILFQDGIRISGELDATGEQQWTLRSPHVQEPLGVTLADLRSLMVFHAADEAPPALPGEGEGRLGRLEIGPLKLRGRLVPHTESPGEHCLAWQPVGSRLSSPLRPDVSGRIVYHELEPKSPPSGQRVIPEARAQPGRNFADLFLQRSREAGVTRGGSSHQLHLRSGDVVPCTVEGMNEEGVLIASGVAAARVVPHAQIKAVELVSGAKPPDLAAAKKKRLLTLPRLQKASPPTHLLCSRTGDFLRCRVIAMNDVAFQVEIQLEELEIPRDRVAQIIWFHEDELEATAAGTTDGAPLAASSGDGGVAGTAPPTTSRVGTGLVQGVFRNGHRITCHPQAFDGAAVTGTSDVLGACRIQVQDVAQLLFGREILADVASLAYHEWRLQPAIEPLFHQEGGDQPGHVGSLSPLVGQAAPEIDLELLSGGRFKLSEYKGQLVVLDFWASWCGPCMQTMPLVERLLEEFDDSEVRLVSVNLEEQPDQIRGVLERHNLNVPVALDLDGVAARRYQANAIPQLVVVDREGRVARLYIGGGPQVVEQLRAALVELLTAPPSAPTAGQGPDA
jgi:thiol-disulfide isomerase/thioredoxin